MFCHCEPDGWTITLNSHQHQYSWQKREKAHFTFAERLQTSCIRSEEKSYSVPRAAGLRFALLMVAKLLLDNSNIQRLKWLKVFSQFPQKWLKFVSNLPLNVPNGATDQTSTYSHIMCKCHRVLFSRPAPLLNKQCHIFHMGSMELFALSLLSTWVATCPLAILEKFAC